MSVDLSRLQQLAEAVGWKIENNGILVLTTNTGTIVGSQSAIRKRLEAGYRKMAEQAHDLQVKATKAANVPIVSDEVSVWFRRIADELAVKEPTMVERLKDYAERNPDHSEFRALALDALIDLYERKEK